MRGYIYVYMYVGLWGGVGGRERECVICLIIIIGTMSVEELYKQDYNVPLHYDVIMTSQHSQ